MSVTDAPRRLLTLDEVAQRLHLSRRTIERMVAAELLPAFRVGPRTIRIDPDELEEWLADSAVGSGSSAEAVGRSSAVDAPVERRAPESVRQVEAQAHAGENR
jgi:excisionase family DNA binding protein